MDIEGAPVSIRQHIGYLPETPPLYTEMTVSEFLTFTGKLRGMSSDQVKARMPDVLKRCQLSHQEHRVIDELSHGYRKRVGIAQAIIHKPKLIILDEPISGLDPVQIVEMRSVIKGLAAEGTVLVSSHILSEIEQTCDRVLVLNEGRLVADDSPHALATRLNTGRIVELTVLAPANLVTQALGNVANIGKLTILREHEGRTAFRLEMEKDVREAVVAKLVGTGIGIRRLEDAKDELEEIFICLTRGTAA